MVRMRLLSHNVFWAQGSPFPTDQPGQPDPFIVGALVGQYRTLAPDILCLQEVQSEAAYQVWRRALDMEGTYCPGLVQRHYGVAAFWKHGRLLFDARSGGEPVQRAWQVIEVLFGNGDSLSVGNIHLPSGRQVGQERARELRVNEVQHILDGSDPPHVLAGDFNEGPGGPLTDYLIGQGYVDSALLTAPQGTSPAPTALGGGRGDYIWVCGHLKDCVAQCGTLSRAVLALCAEGKTSLSDHMPLWADLTLLK